MDLNKPAATLTDVKNKTGDVFALADKNGAVMITSYNKPKYVICKYTVFEELQAAKSQPAKTVVQAPVEKKPEATKEVVKEKIVTPVAVPVVAPVAPAVVESIVDKVTAKLGFGQKPEAPKEAAKKEVKVEAIKPVAKGNKNLEFWNRRSNLEQNWVKQVKSLL